MKITTELVDYLSTLSRLSLPQEEKEAMAPQLEEIIGYMDVLNALDTGDQEAVSHIFPVKTVMREDQVVPSAPREELLKNAPASDGETVLVPKAVE